MSRLFSLCFLLSCSVPFYTRSISPEMLISWESYHWAPCLIPLRWVWPTGGRRWGTSEWNSASASKWVKECKAKLSVIHVCIWGVGWGVGHKSREMKGQKPELEDGSTTDFNQRERVACPKVLSKYLLSRLAPRSLLRENTALTRVFPAWVEMRVIETRRWGERADLVGRRVRLGVCGCAESSAFARPFLHISSSSEAGFPTAIAWIPSVLRVATNSRDRVPSSLQSVLECSTNLTIF